MKPAPFDYFRPRTAAEAAAALASSDSAKVLAGGQSLIPAMNFRLAQPALLVDIKNAAGLGEITEEADGMRIGAAVTQTRVMQSAPAAAAVPGLRLALRWVGHLPIRNRGTVCGSLAHADPAAELPALAMAYGARLTILGPQGERTARAEDFFLGPYWTDLQPAELITAVWFPTQPRGTVTLVDEVARRSGDFAIAGLAALLELEEGEVRGGRLAGFGVGGRPQRLTAAEEAIRGFRPGSPDGPLREAAYQDAAPAVDDGHASSEYRREALGALLTRTVRRAVSDNPGKEF